MENETYDPTNIKPYLNTEFVTRNSVYGIDEQGKFLNRPSIHGAEIELVAAVTPDGYFQIRTHLGSYQGLKDKILEIGKEPARGLHLVVSLTEEAAKERKRFGLVTSYLKEVNKK